MTATTSDLRPLLKRLKLGRMLDTLPERIALARRDHLDYADFLQILLVDEVSRRDHGRLELRLRQAGVPSTGAARDLPPAGAGRGGAGRLTARVPAGREGLCSRRPAAPRAPRGCSAGGVCGGVEASGPARR